jgi:isopenicillin N synthase-like dioxygenase
MSNFRSIPVINIAALRSDDSMGRRLCAKRIGWACREIGFFYVVNHGVDRSLVAPKLWPSFRITTSTRFPTREKTT